MFDRDMTDDDRYRHLQASRAQAWEHRCRMCGACCGSIEGDPCECLEKKEDGTYACRVYETRFGEHRTLKGRVFNCVPIRTILSKSWPGDARCAYKKDPSPFQPDQ